MVSALTATSSGSISPLASRTATRSATHCACGGSSARWATPITGFHHLPCVGGWWASLDRLESPWRPPAGAVLLGGGQACRKPPDAGGSGSPVAAPVVPS